MSRTMHTQIPQGMDTQKSKLTKIGYAEIIASGFFFGFLGVFGKSAFHAGITPGELLGIRFLFSGFLFFILLSFFQRQALFMTRKSIVISCLLGIFGYAVFSSFYFMALEGVSASLTVLLLYTYPTLVTLGDRVFFHRKMGKKGVFALVISFLGLVALVAENLQVSGYIYLVYGFASAFFYAVYILLSRKFLKDVSALGSSCFLQLSAGVTLSLLHFSHISRPVDLVLAHPGLFMGMAIICSLIPLTLFLSGLQKVSPSEASLLSTTEPLFGVIIAAVLLSEKVSFIQLIGGVFVLAAMILTANLNRNFVEPNSRQ